MERKGGLAPSPVEFLLGYDRDCLVVAESARLAMFVDRLKAFVWITLCEVRKLSCQRDIFVDADLVTVLHVFDLIFHYVVFFLCCAPSWGTRMSIKN